MHASLEAKASRHCCPTCRVNLGDADLAEIRLDPDESGSRPVRRTQHGGIRRMPTTTIRRTALWASALAVLVMSSVTVACSPRNERPAETSVAPSPSNSAPSPTEKGMRTNVTRSPISAVAPGGGGNPAVPCGFGPQGGSGCSSN